jgi:DNA polymerase-3 subunit epsilon
MELSLLTPCPGRIDDFATVLDTLELARDLHPGQRNSLDALCKRYAIDDSSRTLHGALLDAEILAEVYLAMTGGQSDLGLSFRQPSARESKNTFLEMGVRPPLTVLAPSADETALHRDRLAEIEKQSGRCLWLELDQPGGAKSSK